MPSNAASSLFPRAAGVLLPVSSLPSPYGIGSFGQTARQWVDFLREAGQSYWQILPLGPTGYGDSPYQSFSAFAGNPYYIDLDTLREEGLLTQADIAPISWGGDEQKVDYIALYRFRETVLRKAFAHFDDSDALDMFAAEHPWLEAYGLFMAIKATQGQQSWIKWDAPLRLREEAALREAKRALVEDIRYHTFAQYLFHKQWHALRAYANAHEVEIIGDIPIYVSLDSADAWAEPKWFVLDQNALPIDVAGCPPDSFSPHGQLWGNPLYDWAAMANTGYAWWIERLRANFTLYNALRIDHFRGFESFFAIPYGASTAADGKWRPGPGMGFITAIQQALPKVRIIVEDLGFLTDEVRALRQHSGYPGMKVLQFAFDARESGDYSPYTYETNAAVYPGTHDNDTVKGWGDNAPAQALRDAMAYTGINDKTELPQAMVRLALETNANLAIIPMQDWLGLGSEARLNIPSTIGGDNWRWRLGGDALDGRLAETMSKMVALYGRMPPSDNNSTLNPGGAI